MNPVADRSLPDAQQMGGEISLHKVGETSEGIVVRIRDTERDSMKIVQGQINAPVPPAVLWSVITDYEAYPRIFDRYRKMEILEKSGSWELHRSEVDYPIFGSRWVSNVLQHDRPGLKIRFQREPKIG